MRFTLRQLSYFVAAGDAGSILKASENIHVSQPSISNAISHLESTFDIQLFIRHHAQGISLTTAGREFFREAKTLLAKAEQLHSFAGELSQQVIGTIEVGCFITLAPIITPDLCHGFMAQHPKSEIRVREAHQATLLPWLRQGSIDLALTYDLQLQNDVEFIPLAKLPPYVLLGSGHRLANQKILTLEELENEPLILLDLPLSSEYFMSLFNNRGLKPLIKARTHLIEVQRGMVAKGYGYSLANVRPCNKQSLDGSALKYIRLANAYKSLTLGVAVLRNLIQTPVQKSFIEYCLKSVSDEKIPGMTPSFD